MRERIESKHVTKEIKSQMPVIPVAIVKERGCTFCPYYLGNYEKQPRCMMKTCAWDDENERFHPVLRELIPFYKEKMEKAGRSRRKPETDSGTKAYLEGEMLRGRICPCLCQVSRRNADGRNQYLRISGG